MVIYQQRNTLFTKSTAITFIILLIISTTSTSTSLSTSLTNSNTLQTSVEELEVVYPIIIQSSSRKKRHISDSVNESYESKYDSLRIHFTAFNKPFNARLVLNTELLAPAATVEILGINATTLHKGILKNCFYNGKLEDESDSFASISYCQGLNGIIDTKDARYTIKPSTNYLNIQRSKRPYDVQRHPHAQLDPSDPDKLPRLNMERDANGMALKIRKRRTVEYGKHAEQTIETLLVVDQKMVEYHGLDAAKQYSLAVASIAHEILRDPSIGPNTVNLVVVKILILVAPQENLVINHHAQKTLNSFGIWAGLQLKNAKAYNFDYAVLLTRYNVCKDSEEPCDNSGISFVGGMCKFPTSASVIQDIGLSSAFALAHQTGHNLGMQHDGVGNPCEGRNRIMNGKGGRGEGAYLWSTCSADYLQRFLRTDQSGCLNDLPAIPKEESYALNAYINSGMIYDLDSQCKLFAGEKAKGCYYGDPVEICVELLCYVPDHSSCISTRKPSVDGTSCGTNKWCKHGRCIEKYFSDSQVIDGGWSAWTDFNACTRPCGGGVTFRERKCQNPKPKHGGKACDGDVREYRICHSQACDNSIVKFRQHQCNEKSGSFLGDKMYDWTFLEDKEFSCTLICSAETDKNIIKNFGHAADGTECYDLRSNVPGRCVGGQCIPVGCNLVLGSKEKIDRCGVCMGDGNSCKEPSMLGQTKQAVFVNATDKRTNLVNIDNSTVKITTRLNNTNPLNATGLVADDRNFTSENQTISNNTSSQLNANATGNFNDMDHISNVLQKLKTLRILMKAILRKRCTNDEKCLMRYKYFDMKHKKAEIPLPKEFEWVILSSGCSVTCGIGTATLSSECRRVDDGSPVASKNCIQKLKPVIKTKACHMPACPASWTTGDWDSCSKSCGGGIQSRDVYCVKNINEDFVVSDEMCNTSSKPATKQICNKEACPAKWVTEPFGKCSTSCGRGIQRREVFCMLDKSFKSEEIVDDGQCEAIKKPQREMVCNVHYPCPGDDYCGGNFTKKTDTITSPGFPGQYPNNKECISEITVSNDKSIMLEFSELKIGGATDSMNKCGGDFLRITDGSCVDAANLPYTVYCGLEKPKDLYISTSNKLCLKFVSDDTETNKGFSVTYIAVDKKESESKVLDICDAHGKIVNSVFGAINSPNYPEIYPLNEHCKLTISAPDMSGFLLSFKGFNVGSKSKKGKCADDHLLIEHDGIVRKLCGEDNSITRISTMGNKFVVSFHSSDIRISGVGFVLTYITKKFLKQQFESINQKKQERLLGYKPVNSVLRLPTINGAAASNLRHTNGKPKMLVEALTSLKKNVINQPKNVSKSSKSATNSLSLKHVLDLLGGGSSAGKQAVAKVKKSNVRTNRKQLPPFEDYTKAGIYKKAKVPTVRQEKQTALSEGFEERGGCSLCGKFLVHTTLPWVNIYLTTLIVLKPTVRNRFALLTEQDRKSSGRHVGLQVLNQPPKKALHFLSSAEEWKMYWNAYRKNHGRRNSIPNGLHYKMSPYWMYYNNYNVPKSYIPQRIAGNIKAYGRTCPARNTLTCPAVSVSYACNNVATCGYHPRMSCCSTFCPYKPSVCIWT